MSKYQELKGAALAAASKYRETGSLEDRDALDKAEEKLHEFERGAAELIERAQEELKKWCVDFCNNTPCSDCQTRELIEEIESLTKGGAK